MIELENIELKYTSQIRVRYAETDAMAVVNNVDYLVYFEVGRTELMRHYGLPYTVVEKNGFLLPLIEARVFYKNPAHYDDLLNIETSLKPEYKPIIKFEYNIFRDNSTIANGYTVHSFLNSETRRPVKPPKIFIDTVLKANAKTE